MSVVCCYTFVKKSGYEKDVDIFLCNDNNNVSVLAKYGRRVCLR